MFTVEDENTEIIESTDFEIVQGSLESSNVDTIRNDDGDDRDDANF